MDADFISPTMPPPGKLIGALREWALFLDFDGTLVDIAATPDAIVVPPEVPALLDDLDVGFGGALAILTGRALADLDRHLGGARHAAAGQHGAEWRLAGERARVPVEAGVLADPRAAIARFAATHPGVLVEDKGASIALHYRGAPKHKAAVETLAAALVASSGGALEAMSGKALTELRPTGANKGRALRTFLAARPFADRRPLVLGDDVTDESAFAAALAAGGEAVKVGAGASAARWRLADPAAVRRWLRQLL